MFIPIFAPQPGLPTSLGPLVNLHIQIDDFFQARQGIFDLLPRFFHSELKNSYSPVNRFQFENDLGTIPLDFMLSTWLYKTDEIPKINDRLERVIEAEMRQINRNKQ